MSYGLTNRQAEAVIAAVAVETGVAAPIITGRSRMKPHCEARREVWRRLVALGACSVEAAMATGHEASTVRHGLRRT